MKIGQKNNKLTLIKICENKKGNRQGIFRCDCGTEKEIRISAVSGGGTKSCGCYAKVNARRNGKVRTTHGDTKSRLYSVYQTILQECNSNCKGYKNKTICDEWKNDYVKFKTWCLNNGWNKNKGIYTKQYYSPENCEMLSSQECKSRKTKDTNLKKYGCEKYHASSAYKQMLKEKEKENLQKYGCKHYSQTKEFKEKTKKSNLEKYGVDHYMKLDKYRNLARENTIKNGQANTYNGLTTAQIAQQKGFSVSGFTQLSQKLGIEEAFKLNNKKQHKSIIEDILEDILIKNNIEYEKQYKIENRIVDFKIDNLIIECDGLYWHSELKKDKYYHRDKRDLFIKLGYNPLFFYEDEIIRNRDIVESIILNKINKSKIIYARKTSLQKIDNINANLFFKENHLMGRGSGTTLGLFIDDEIVCAMRFIQKDGFIDISRFCCKKYYNVVGGFSKLLKNIEKQYKPDCIQNFIDLRYGSGEYLQQFGFEESTCHLSFNWVKNNDRLHRLKFPGNSGYENNFVKLWDCGQRKFIKNINKNNNTFEIYSEEVDQDSLPKKELSRYYENWRTIIRKVKAGKATICEDWKDFKNFETWAKKYKQDGLFLYAKDEYYSPDTCKYVNRSEFSSLKNIPEKRKQTTLKKYGVEHYTQTKDFKENFKFKDVELAKKRREETCLKKYGVENVFKNETIKDKQKKAVFKKYGVENVFKNEDIKKKIRKTNKSKYGVEYTQQNQDCKDKTVETNIRKYGKPYYTQTKEYLEKSRKTNLKNCGYTHFSKTPKGKTQFIKNVGQTSQPELEIQKFLNSFGYNFNKNYKIIPGQEIDLYDDQLKIGIEYCGIYWHSEKFLKDKNKHLNKLKLCEEKDVRLITIFEDEWINRKTMVKNFLRSVIGKNKTIFARKCVFSEVDNNIAKEFINNYHIQELKRVPKYSFGLFSNNQLVSVMTFDRHHRNNNANELVLNRFCTIQNYTVVGGGSKLLKNAIDILPKENIISWSDKRYSQGDFYRENGFEFVNNLLPDYSYVNNKIPFQRFSKQSMKKSNIDCPHNITEKDFLQSQNIYRIWDCGKVKWEFLNS